MLGSNPSDRFGGRKGMRAAAHVALKIARKKMPIPAGKKR
jgi:hypothetical protein